MTAGKVAYEQLRASAAEWAASHEYDRWMSDILYVRVSLDDAQAEGWSADDTESAARASQYAWKRNKALYARVVTISGLVPCAVGVLTAHMKLGYGGDEYAKWLITSLGAAALSCVALLKGLGVDETKERAKTWRGFCETLMLRVRKLERKS